MTRSIILLATHVLQKIGFARTKVKTNRIVTTNRPDGVDDVVIVDADDVVLVDAVVELDAA